MNQWFEKVFSFDGILVWFGTGSDNSILPWSLACSFGIEGR